MSGKNALRMIFFALVLMVIIGGGYTADCVFAESGERDVTLDISMASSPDFKIFDKTGKEVEKVSSEKLPKEEREIKTNGFDFTTEVMQWKLKLTPGEYAFKVYNLIGTLNSETVFKVTENGDNHHHFVVYNINIYDSDNPDADIKCSAKVTDADDREIKVTDYKFESEFEENGEKVKRTYIRKNFILKYEKGCRYDISVKHEDPAYAWRKCRVGYWALEYAFKDGYLMPSFKKDSFNLSLVSEGLLWHLPYADLYCTKDRVTYKFRYPKDLENFRICQQNDAATQIGRASCRERV